MRIKPCLLVATLTASVFSQAGLAQTTDADLAAFWDFESGRTGTDVWSTHLHGTASTPNCYDTIGGIGFIDAKNQFFVNRFDEPTLSVRAASDEGIPAFNGLHVLRATVFNDEQAYLDYAASQGEPTTPHQSNVKARIDPGVPMGHLRVGDGDEVWFGFAFYLPTDYVFDSLSWAAEAIMELQYREDIPSYASSKGGPFGIGIGNGVLHIGTTYSPTYQPKDASSADRKNVTFPLQKGVWYSVVCHVRFDYTYNAFAEVWINGQKIMDEHGIRIGYAGMLDAKMGMDVMTNYKHNWFLDPSAAGYSSVTPAQQFMRSIYFDALRVAPVNTGSYAMVDPEKPSDYPAAVPSTPSGLDAAGGNGSVSLDWDTAGGAASYSVKRSTTSGSSYTTIATGLTATAYTDVSVTNGTTYFYVVSATNSAGESANSSEAAATPLNVSGAGVAAVDASSSDNNVPGGAIDGDLGTRWSVLGQGEWIRFQLDDIYTVSAIDIAWHKGDLRQADFQVETSLDGTNWTTVLPLTSASGTTLQLEDHDLTDGPASWVRIVGFGYMTNDGLQSADWNSITEVVIHGDILTAPTAPTGVSALGSDTEVSLSWSASGGATGYSVFRSTLSGSGYALLASGLTQPGYVDGAVSNGVSYYYVVSAGNAAGDSGYSAEVSATPNSSASVAVAGVSSSAEYETSIDDNAIDNDLGSVWSSNGLGNWIALELTEPTVVSEVQIAWYRGDERQAYFTVEGATDGVNWFEMLPLTSSSGTTLAFESYDVADRLCSWVRITGQGNSAPNNNFVSITEIDVIGHEPPEPVQPAIVDVYSSSDDGSGNIDDNTLDGDLSTRWSALGQGEWISFELTGELIVDSIHIAWHKGDLRQAHFRVEGSVDGTTWFELLPLTDASGTTLALESYDLPDRVCTWVRIMGYGYTNNGGQSSGDYTSITEIVLLGYTPDAPIVNAVDASGYQTGHPPADAIDGNLTTRWSQEGLGEWIRFEFAESHTVASVGIAWLNGDQRKAAFEIQGSGNGTDWITLLPLTDASGTTTELEYYDVPDAGVSWLRIVGYGFGSNDGLTTGEWNSINEALVVGY